MINPPDPAQAPGHVLDPAGGGTCNCWAWPPWNFPCISCEEGQPAHCTVTYAWRSTPGSPLGWRFASQRWRWQPARRAGCSAHLRVRLVTCTLPLRIPSQYTFKVLDKREKAAVLLSDACILDIAQGRRGANKQAKPCTTRSSHRHASIDIILACASAVVSPRQLHALLRQCRPPAVRRSHASAEVGTPLEDTLHVADHSVSNEMHPTGLQQLRDTFMGISISNSAVTPQGTVQ